MKIEEIKTEFGIEGATTEEVRRELKKKLASIHPDKNQGTFSSTQDKELFSRITDVMEQLDNLKHTPTSLISISEAKELIEFVTSQVGLVKKNNESDNQQNKIDQIVTRNIINLKSRFRIPRITSTAIAVVISSLWLFPNQIEEHPVLSKFIDIQSFGFFLVWSFVLLLTCALWVFTKYQENNQEEYIKNLNSIQYQNKMFTIFKAENKYEDNFQKEDFILFLSYGNRKFWSLSPMTILYRTKIIDSELAESIADIVFARAEEKGIIKVTESIDLIDFYTFVNKPSTSEQQVS